MHTPQLSDKLRRALLQAAIEGKLSERQADDGHAQDLLKQIQAEKAALVKAGRLKKSKGLPEIGEDEKPFEIPENWVWVRLGEIGSWSSGATPNRSNPDFYRNGEINWLKTGDLNDGYIKETSEKITALALEKCSVTLQPVGSVLIAMYGATIGKLGILDIPSTTNQACCACVPFDGILNKYLFYFLIFNRANFILMGAGGAQPNISKEKIVSTVMPLPPLAEQARIVAKLDALLAETDALKAQESALADAQKNFPKMLRASLLQAAIEGKLTERESEDGHAQELLQQIQAEKAAQIQAGRLKKSKGLPEIGEDEKPFAIPENWVWVRLGEVILNNIGGGTPSKHNPSYWNGDIPWASVKDLNCDVLTKTIDTITAEGLENSSSNLIPKDTFVICTRMGLGKIALTEIDVAINQDLRAIFLSEFIDKKYFYHFYRSLKIEGKGATVKGITVEELHNILFPLPPLAEQARIVAKLDALLAQIESLENLS